MIFPPPLPMTKRTTRISTKPGMQAPIQCAMIQVMIGERSMTCPMHPFQQATRLHSTLELHEMSTMPAKLPRVLEDSFART